ncbi:carbohydrate ABC transporter permease [Haploplasma axanthum]|uniref:Inner membrane ABC transporter permease protein ycjP n=1 Tax=Haploplasma axanthum TaxID=29552 RepID=A0A449BCI9_HAPAX|nr:carbohydrate ABC transporter permease [Haploplasma axanthum]VEU80050.1 Inner membrane ABC transporter permease protein ycjP [Haploplasma axanthum]
MQENTKINQELQRTKFLNTAFTVIKYTFLVVMAVFILLPFYWMLATSVKSTAEISSGVVNFFPKSFELSNYPTAIETAQLGRAFINTLIVAFFSTTLGTLVAVFSAFALARLNFKGREVVFMILLATMMIPGEMMVLTNYVTVTAVLGWGEAIGPNAPSYQVGPYLSMIVPFLVSVFHIYLLRNTFRQIPDELYLAAKVDNTSDFKYLTKIMLPMASSSIITIVIMKIIGAWNSFVWPNLVGGKRHKLITAQLRSSFTDGEGQTLYNQQMAAVVVVVVPLMILFIVFRKYIMRGISRGGTKG